MGISLGFVALVCLILVVLYKTEGLIWPKHMPCVILYELHREKTRFLPMRKQRRRSDQLCSYCTADQRLCFRYTDSTISLLLKSEVSSF